MNSWTDFGDPPHNFVPGDPRVRKAGKAALFDERITMTDPARLDLDKYLVQSRLGYRPINDLEVASWPGHLCDFHGTATPKEYMPISLSKWICLST